MSLIISLGSNIGEREKNLVMAIESLKRHFLFIKASTIAETAPVDYLDQPYFLNQLVEFELPKLNPFEVLTVTQSIEQAMGRVKYIPKGPRNIDIDILFFGLANITSENLIIPHHAWNKRPFNLEMLEQLNFFQKIRDNFASCDSFESFFH